MSLMQLVAPRPWLKKMLTPVSNWYLNAAGYRQLGLHYDDLINEENEDVQTALKRLTPKESYDRVFRLRRATQLSLQQKILPKTAWTKPQDDKPYIQGLLAAIEAEAKEREALDTVVPMKAH